MKILFSISLFATLLFGACRSASPDDSAANSPWVHRGITYPNSAEYLKAVEHDKFTRRYPPEARIADFRAFDDRRLGLYYFHYLRSSQTAPAKISSETEADLRKALEERGLTQDQLESIKNGSLHKGMPAAALFAAWGPPLESYRSQTREGETIQHIYLDETGRQISIFTQNGRLTF